MKQYKSVPDCVMWIMQTHYGPDSRLLPVSQRHLQLDVQDRMGRKIDRLAFGRCLNRMAATGRIRRVFWFNPCEGNVWEVA